VVMTRTAHIARQTNETDVTVTLSIDGSGTVDVCTGVPFFDHMLHVFARHGLFDLVVAARGDVHIDDHHTVEDVALCLGRAVCVAVGDKIGVQRYGHAIVPMDEAMATVAIDLSGRAYFGWRGKLPGAFVKTFDAELVHEFLWKFSQEAKLTLHVQLDAGDNTHHCIEAVFKALGRALDVATRIDERVVGVPSTKGVL
jgi:imidazoleglycerol-phosphate dehydratase